MADTIRIGVIGAGSMATRVHVPSLFEIEDAEVTAICDRIPSRAQELAEKFGIRSVYTQQEEMLAKEHLDAAVVLVEPASLYHVVRRCLEAKLPVFMEKPPGTSSFQAESLSRAAEEAGVTLAVGFNRRYIPLVRHVVNYVRERTEITQIEGRFMKEGRADFDAGSLSAFPSDAIHCVDLVRSIANSEPEAAATVVSRSNDVVDNMWNSVCRFRNGITATIRSNYQTGGRVHTFELFGPGVSAFIDLGFAQFSCSARVVLGSGNQGYSLAATGAGAVEVVEFDGFEIAGSDEFRKYYGYYQEVEDFVRCLTEGGRPICTIADAAASFRMVDFLLSSAI